MNSALLVSSQIRPAANLARRAPSDDNDLAPSDAALHAVTDFQREYPITVPANHSIDEALEDMIRLRVHALLVTEHEPDCDERHIIGLVTSNDIHRARARRGSIGAADCGGPMNICVADVMTPREELPLVKYDSLKSLTALDLHEMFQGTGLTHLLVVEIRDDGSVLVRGLLSRATLAKRLLHIRFFAPNDAH